MIYSKLLMEKSLIHTGNHKWTENTSIHAGLKNEILTCHSESKFDRIAAACLLERFSSNYNFPEYEFPFNLYLVQKHFIS